MPTWTFTGLDGKRCLFHSDRIKSFLEPKEVEVPLSNCVSKTRFCGMSGEGRTVIIWQNTAYGKSVNVDVYSQEAHNQEELLAIQPNETSFSYEREGEWPDSNTLLEIGKFFTYSELPTDDMPEFVKGFEEKDEG